MSGQGGGMSRAAMKKRKRQQKQAGPSSSVGGKRTTAITGLQLPSVPESFLGSDNDDDDDEVNDGHDNDSDTWSESDDDGAAAVKSRKASHKAASSSSSQAKKSRKDQWTFHKRASIQHPLMASVADLTISNILALKDVHEATVFEKAALLLTKLTYPTTREQFYEDIWERVPTRFQHNLDAYDEGDNGNEAKLGVYYGKLVTKKMLRKTLGEHLLTLGKDVRLITADNEYIPNNEDNEGDHDDEEDKEEQAMTGDELWKKFASQNHVLELLQPHVHFDILWQLFSSFEYEFGCRVDGHLILQPSKHELSIPVLAECDKFVLQLEGKTTWYLSKPSLQTEDENEDNKKDSKAATFDLTPGQCLYIPKGYLSSEEGDESQHSLFLTLMINNNEHTPADLFKLVLPQAIDSLQSESKFFQRSFPADLNRVLGVACSENVEDNRRNAFNEDMTKLLQMVVQHTMDILDPAADQMAKKKMMEKLPPSLTSAEENVTAAGAPQATIFPYTQLRMVRPDVAIAVVEDGKIVLYHCMDNSRELFGNALNPMEFELDDGPAIEALLKAYPEPVTVNDLEHPSEDMEDKVGVAQALYKEGFLMIVDEASQPAKEGNSDDDSDDPF